MCEVVGVTGFEPALLHPEAKGSEPIVSRRPQLSGTRVPNRSITCRQRYTVRTGRSYYESIRWIALKSPRQAIERNYDVSVEGQNCQNSRFRRARQPVGKRKR